MTRFITLNDIIRVSNAGVISITAGDGLLVNDVAGGITSRGIVGNTGVGTISLNFARANTWTGAQTFTSNNLTIKGGSNLILQGTSTINVDPSTDYFNLNSNKGVQIRLDADNNSTYYNEFAINNGANEQVFSVNELGYIIKGSIDWDQIRSIPTGFSDGVDHRGVTSLSIPTGGGLKLLNSISGIPSALVEGDGGIISLDFSSNNTWTGVQAFSGKVYLNSDVTFPGSGVWDSNGNVGIGIAPSQTEKLYVKGDIRIDGTTQTTAGLFSKFMRINVDGTNYLTPLYSLGSQTTAVPVPTQYNVVYNTLPNTHDGNFASNGEATGRLGADRFCVANKPTNLTCANIHALLDVKVIEDTRQDMPKNYGYDSSKPIYWWDSNRGAISQIKPNWGTIVDSISNTEIVGSPDKTYTSKNVYTGDVNALSSASNCKNWTSNSVGISSQIGSNDNLSGWQLNSLVPRDPKFIACNSLLYIRCICIVSP